MNYEQVYMLDILMTEYKVYTKTHRIDEICVLCILKNYLD